MLGNKLAEITEHDEGYRSIEEKGSSLLEAYASAYDEIVQGYADGTRNVYVEDEARIHQAVDASKAFDKYMAKLSKIDMHRAEMATKAKEFFDKMKKSYQLC